MKYTSTIKGSLLLTLVCCNPVFAEYQYQLTDNQQIQISGYVGYQYLFSDNKITNTYDGNGQPQLGTNIIYSNGDNFQIFNQFRYGENIDQILVYNFLQYRFDINNNTSLTVQGGKIRYDVGLYNKTRINPITRRGIIQPEAIYWSALNEFMICGTGIGISLKHKDVELSAIVDKPTINDKYENQRVLWAGLTDDVDVTFGSHYVISLDYTSSSIPLRTTSSYAHINMGKVGSKVSDYLYPEFVGKDITGEQIAFGVEYKIHNDILLAGETMWFLAYPQEWIHDWNDVSKGYSLSATYTITDYMDIRLNYNRTDATKLKVNTFRAAPWMGKREDINLGLNLHHDGWTFQTEGHYIQGGRTMDPLDTKGNAPDYKNWWMVGVSLVYSF